jgi:hypothetical protein
MIDYIEAKRRWEELKIAASRRELTESEMAEFDVCYEVVKANN